MSTKISDLTAATSVADADILPIVQGGVNKKATRLQLLTAATPSSGAGNDLIISASAGVSANGAGGSILLKPAAGHGSGAAGVVIIREPGGTPGTQECQISQGQADGQSSTIIINKNSSGSIRFFIGSTEYIQLNASYLQVNTALILPNGTVSAPSLAFASTPTYGFFRSQANSWGWSGSAAERVRFDGSVSVWALSLRSDTYFAWNNAAFTTDVPSSLDTYLSREAAATIQMGLDVNGAAVNQTFKAHDGITGTDIAGATLTLAGGRGTGAGTGGSFIIATPTTLGTGTTAQTLVTRLTVSRGAVTSDAWTMTLGSGGSLLLPAGTAAVPSLAAAANPDSGFYYAGAGIWAHSRDGVPTVDFDGIGLPSDKRIQWYTSAVVVGSTDLVLAREAAATLQMGDDVNGAAINQTFKAHDGITGTDIAGATMTLAGGRGTGAGTGGSFLIATPTTLGTGTTAQTLATRITVSRGAVTSDAWTMTLGAGGALLVPDGTAAAPAYSFSAAPTYGFYSAFGALDVAILGVRGATFGADAFYLYSDTQQIVLGAAADLTLCREAAATIQMGLDVNGAAVNQTFKAHDGITGTDIAGATLTLAGGRGTGAGTGGSFIIATPTTLGTGTTAQTLVTRLTVSRGAVTSDAWTMTLGSGGSLLLPDGAAATPVLASSSDPTVGLFFSGTSVIITRQGATNSVALGASGGIEVRNDGFYAWSSTTDANATGDLFLARDAANTLAQRFSTNNQIFNHYGRYVSATNHNRLAIKHQVTTLSAVSGATVVATGAIPAKVIILGVSTSVTTGLGTGSGTTGYTVGDGSDADRWGDITGTAAGTDSDYNDYTAAPIPAWNAAAQDITITAKTGNFNGTGVIVVDVAYMASEAD